MEGVENVGGGHEKVHGNCRDSEAWTDNMNGEERVIGEAE